MPHIVIKVILLFFLLYLILFDFLDTKTNRPLVGYVILNEHYVSYEDGNYKNQISTFIHEVLHALYFDPSAFQYFPNTKNGEKFMVTDEDGIGYLQGDMILKTAREHFNCPTIKSGIFIIKFNLTCSSIGRSWANWISRSSL
jgi:hypothetical protein